MGKFYIFLYKPKWGPRNRFGSTPGRLDGSGTSRGTRLRRFTRLTALSGPPAALPRLPKPIAYHLPPKGQSPSGLRPVLPKRPLKAFEPGDSPRIDSLSRLRALSTMGGSEGAVRRANRCGCVPRDVPELSIPPGVLPNRCRGP